MRRLSAAPSRALITPAVHISLSARPARFGIDKAVADIAERLDKLLVALDLRADTADVDVHGA